MRTIAQKLLIFMMIISAGILTFVKTSAQEKPEIILNVIESAGKNTVTVEIELNNNPGITAFRFEIEYDDKVMKLVHAEFDEASKDFNTGTSQFYKSPYSISGYNAGKDVTSNGKIAVLSFQITGTVNTGKYPVSIKYDAEDIFNMKGENVLFEIPDNQTDENKTEYINNEDLNEKNSVKKPEKIKGLKVQIKNKKIKVRWKKVSGVKGYKVLISTSKKFSKKKTTKKKIVNNHVTIKKLKPNKIYYVKVCGYKVINGKKAYGNYSAVKKVKFN